nr:hypothetical protein [Atopomonas sediminilitoris]
MSGERIDQAVANALNYTAYDLRERLRNEMRAVFDRPTLYTLNSLRVEKATPQSLSARILIPGEASDTKQAPTRWLAPQVYAGDRTDKRSEYHLRQRSILPPGKFMVPGKGVKLDRHGNLPKGTLTQILSGIRAYSDLGYEANASRSKRSQAKGNARRFFVLREGGQAIGVAERVRWGKGSRNDIRMVLAFVKKPSYAQRLDFFDIAQAFVEQALPERLERAIARALAV